MAPPRIDAGPHIPTATKLLLVFVKNYHPVLRTIFLFLLIYIQISTPVQGFKTHPSKNHLNQLFFSNIFCFLKEIFRRITWPPPSNKKHPPAFGPGPVAPPKSLHWPVATGLVWLWPIFSSPFACSSPCSPPPQKKWLKPLPQKKVWQVNIETIQEKGEVFILCDYVTKCFERTSIFFRCNQATG